MFKRLRLEVAKSFRSNNPSVYNFSMMLQWDEWKKGSKGLIKNVLKMNKNLISLKVLNLIKRLLKLSSISKMTSDKRKWKLWWGAS